MIRVLLVDDETVVRTAVAQLLDLEDDLDVVAQAADGREAIDRARVTHPDVAVLDLQMPGLDGIEATRALLREQPSLACVILTSHARAGYLQRALEAGARGFLPKTASPEAVAETIRTVAAGGRHVDPGLAVEAITTGDSPLTPREAEVLAAAEGGAPVSEIARTVHLSNGTVRNYLSHATAKLGTSNRHEAAAKARRLGWL